MEIAALRYTIKYKLAEYTIIYQVSDGTVFYFDRTPIERLYVKWKGEELDAKLPAEKIQIIVGRYKNALFFTYEASWKKSQIFKVVFTPNDGIVVSYFRDQLKGEDLKQFVTTRVRDGNTYAYRICENPFRDGIIIDAEENLLQNLNLKLIHRHKSIVLWVGSVSSEDDHYFADDSSPFIYFAIKDCIHILDTTSMEFLPRSRIDELEFEQIAGIYNGILTAKISEGILRPGYLITGYITNECGELLERQNGFTFKFSSEFTVNKILGVGGFGVVFEASNNLDSWKYAVKRIPVAPNEEKSAQREVHAMAKLHHAGIVRYNCTWTERPPEWTQYRADLEMAKRIGPSGNLLKMNYPSDSIFIYIQMQSSLAEWLDNNRSSSSRSISGMKLWFKQMVSAIAHIHEKGLIHRDIKPSNILLTEENQIKLSDLGLATERMMSNDGNDTVTDRTMAGTSLYMSPEQRCSKYSSKTDVFALGLILTEMCVVMTAIERAQTFDNYRAGIQENIIEDAETADIVMKLTQVDPNNRPTCREILNYKCIQ